MCILLRNPDVFRERGGGQEGMHWLGGRGWHKASVLGWRGGGEYPPPPGHPAYTSHRLPDAKCRLQWRL